MKNFDNCVKYEILDDEMFKDGDDDLSDLTSSEQSQLNDWYDNLSSKYDKVGNIIREVSTVVCLKSGLPCVTIFGESPDFLEKSCF